MEADARSAIASENNDESMDAVSAVVAEEDGGLVLAKKLDFTHFLRAADAGEEQPAEETIQQLLQDGLLGSVQERLMRLTTRHMKKCWTSSGAE